MTEKELRKRDLLSAGDQVIEWKQGKIERWSVGGSAQPLPRAFRKLDIPPLRGLSGCSYSSRRLFFGTNGTLFTDLEWLWHADSSGKVLRAVFSWPQLVAVCWRSDEAEDAAALAGFAERICAQRERRLAELPQQTRQQAANGLTELRRNGLLAAALAEPGAPTS